MAGQSTGIQHAVPQVQSSEEEKNCQACGADGIEALHMPYSIDSAEVPATPRSMQTLEDDEKAALAQAAPKQEHQYVTGLEFYVLLFGMLISLFLVGLDQTIVATAVPKLASDFNALQQVPWVASAYLLPQPGLMLTYGQLLTVTSIRWVFFSAVSLFEIGCAICGAAPNMTILIFGRAVSGVGAAGVMVSFMVLLARISPIEHRAFLFSLVAGVMFVSTVLGPLLGGVLTDRVSWRWCFFLSLPFGVISLTSIASLVKPEYSVPTDKSIPTWKRIARLDWIGSALLVATGTALLLPLQWGGVTKSWNDKAVIASFCVFAILFPVLLAWEWSRGGRAVLPLHLFRSRTQVGCCLEGFFLQVTFSLTQYYLPLYYQSAEEHSATKSGVDLLTYMLVAVVTTLVVGAIISRTGHPLPFLVVPPLFAALAFGLIVWTLVSHPSAKNLLGFEVLAGFGIGCAIQNTLVAIQAEYYDEPQKIPQSSSLVNFSKWTGGALGLAAGGGIFGNRLSSSITAFAPDLPPETSEAVKQSVIAIHSLTGQDKVNVLRAYSNALGCVFAIGIPCMVLASASGLLIKNFDLRRIKKPATPVRQESA
ncbi:hypothetical protein FRB95_000307 [Tulasnella sp. JGI-2019a]|nr:hypothetical protein FRB95_000307 [Tulasnella sp. JGI-2019a]